MLSLEPTTKTDNTTALPVMLNTWNRRMRQGKKTDHWGMNYRQRLLPWHYKILQDIQYMEHRLSSMSLKDRRCKHWQMLLKPILVDKGYKKLLQSTNMSKEDKMDNQNHLHKFQQHNWMDLGEP